MKRRTILPTSCTEPAAPADLDMEDRRAVAAWLTALREHVDDGMAVGFDATAKPEYRQISTAAGRKRIVDHIEAIEKLFGRVKAFMAAGGAR